MLRLTGGVQEFMWFRLTGGVQKFMNSAVLCFRTYTELYLVWKFLSQTSLNAKRLRTERLENNGSLSDPLKIDRKGRICFIKI